MSLALWSHAGQGETEYRSAAKREDPCTRCPTIRTTKPSSPSVLLWDANRGKRIPVTSSRLDHHDFLRL